MNEQVWDYHFHESFSKTEKIDGQVHLMAAPVDEHIDVQGNLNRIFNNYFIQNKKRCRARNDAKMDIDENTYVKPDVQVICREKGDTDIPVIVIEVLSKSTYERDLGVKMDKYAKLGIKEYWIIRWEYMKIDIYLLSDDKKYELFKSYTLCVMEDDDDLDERGLKKLETEFSPVAFPELVIKLEDVFDMFE